MLAAPDYRLDIDRLTREITDASESPHKDAYANELHAVLALAVRLREIAITRGEHRLSAERRARSVARIKAVDRVVEPAICNLDAMAWTSKHTKEFTEVLHRNPDMQAQIQLVWMNCQDGPDIQSTWGLVGH